jgi:hypothetical protein
MRKMIAKTPRVLDYNQKLKLTKKASKKGFFFLEKKKTLCLKIKRATLCGKQSEAHARRPLEGLTCSQMIPADPIPLRRRRVNVSACKSISDTGSHTSSTWSYYGTKVSSAPSATKRSL